MRSRTFNATLKLSYILQARLFRLIIFIFSDIIYTKKKIPIFSCVHITTALEQRSGDFIALLVTYWLLYRLYRLTRNYGGSSGNRLAEPIHLISRKLWLDGMTCNDARKPRCVAWLPRRAPVWHDTNARSIGVYRTKVPIKVIATRLSRPSLATDYKCNWCNRWIWVKLTSPLTFDIFSMHFT